jgi:serine-type D-Ala-D-Ala carboxypeptidase (penicillin-binding protein 5/6)
VLVLVLVAVAVVRRIDAESAPALSIQRTLSAYVQIPGSSPMLSWPHEGQAAVEVEGVGSFGTSGSSSPVPIASVAKVMTAYLTLREHRLTPGQAGFTITITRPDVEEQAQRVGLGESTVPVRRGERLSEREALQALLLPSANNVAVLLAVHEAGSVAAFVARMNATARRLGMSSTSYTDPSGFNPETVSTASDQLKLVRAAMRVPAFAAIVAEPTAMLPVAGRVSNFNALLGEEGYVGVKTGSDSAAGGCLVFAKKVAVGARRLTVLGVVLGQREGALVESALVSARRLGDSAAAALRVETVLPAGASVLSASNSAGHKTTVVTLNALREPGWSGQRVPVTLLVRGPITQLRTGELVARATVGGAGANITDAVAAHSLAGPSLGWRLRHLF